jgi:hypothetical protein
MIFNTDLWTVVVNHCLHAGAATTGNQAELLIYRFTRSLIGLISLSIKLSLSVRLKLFKLRHSQPLIASMPGDPLARLSTPAVKSLIWDQAALLVSPRPAAWHHQ